MSQKIHTSTAKGFLKFHWMDPRLTWNPQEWAGIDLIYLESKDVWRPDTYITNQNNWENYNIAAIDNQLVRVWAARSNLNNKNTDDHTFNVDWSPMLTFDLIHKFKMETFPIDVQEIKMNLESWFTLEQMGGIEILNLNLASEDWESGNKIK